MLCNIEIATSQSLKQIYRSHNSKSKLLIQPQVCTLYKCVVFIRFDCLDLYLFLSAYFRRPNCELRTIQKLDATKNRPFQAAAADGNGVENNSILFNAKFPLFNIQIDVKWP